MHASPFLDHAFGGSWRYRQQQGNNSGVYLYHRAKFHDNLLHYRRDTWPPDKTRTRSERNTGPYSVWPAITCWTTYNNDGSFNSWTTCGGINVASYFLKQHPLRVDDVISGTTWRAHAQQPWRREWRIRRRSPVWLWDAVAAGKCPEVKRFGWRKGIMGLRLRCSATVLLVSLLHADHILGRNWRDPRGLIRPFLAQNRTLLCLFVI